MKDTFTRGTFVRQRRGPDLVGHGSRAARRATAYDAFVPATVADLDLTLSGATAADVADAERALLRLVDATSDINGFEALARSLLRSEAVASSWIEALRVSHRKLAEAEHGAPGLVYDEARRVVGNVRALTRAIELGDHGRPLEVDDLLSMHGMLMSGTSVSIDRERAGQMRNEPVFIGGTGPDTAEYVGPPHDEVPRLLADLVAFVNERADLSGVVQAAVGHAQFESIHPFHDGNGRVGRCLIHTILRRAGLVDAVFAPVSIVLARRGRSYIDGLNAFRRDDLDAWISMFATAITASAAAATEFGAAVVQLEDGWLRQVATLRANANRRQPRADSSVVALIRALPGLPVFEVRDVADRLTVSWKAAESAVLELQTAGVVRQVTAGKRNRVFEAPSLFSLLDRFERDPGGFAAGS